MFCFRIGLGILRSSTVLIKFNTRNKRDRKQLTRDKIISKQIMITKEIAKLSLSRKQLMFQETRTFCSFLCLFSTLIPNRLTFKRVGGGEEREKNEGKGGRSYACMHQHSQHMMMTTFTQTCHNHGNHNNTATTLKHLLRTSTTLTTLRTATTTVTTILLQHSNIHSELAQH